MIKVNSSVNSVLIPKIKEIQKVVMDILKDSDIPLDSFKVIDSMIKGNIPDNCSPEMKAIYYVGYMNGCKATILEASKDLKMIRDDLTLKRAFPKMDTSIN